MFALLERCYRKMTSAPSIGVSEKQLSDYLTKATSSPIKLISMLKRETGLLKST